LWLAVAAVVLAVIGGVVITRPTAIAQETQVPLGPFSVRLPAGWGVHSSLIPSRSTQLFGPEADQRLDVAWASGDETLESAGPAIPPTVVWHDETLSSGLHARWTEAPDGDDTMIAVQVDAPSRARLEVRTASSSRVSASDAKLLVSALTVAVRETAGGSEGLAASPVVSLNRAAAFDVVTGADAAQGAADAGHGAQVRVIRRSEKGHALEATWVEGGGNAAFTARLRDTTRSVISAYERSTGTIYAPRLDQAGAEGAARCGGSPATAADFSITCERFAVVGGLVTESLRIRARTGDASGDDRTETIYGAADGDTIASSTELLDAGALRRALPELLTAVKREMGALDDRALGSVLDADEDAARRAFPEAVLADDGSVRVRVGDARVLSRLSGLPAEKFPPGSQVVVPAEHADALLTASGAKLRTAATSKAPDALPRVAPDCRLLPCVALTFDDGPGPDTGAVLDTLRAHGMVATFFVTGQNATAHPDTVRREREEGHEIGNHTWDHANLRSLTPDAVRREIDRTNQAIHDAAGVTPRWLRPPYGEYDAGVAGIAGTPLALWSVDVEDWRHPPDETIVQRATQVQAGDIILVHDIHAQTVRNVPAILDALQAGGAVLATVSEMFADDPVPPGHAAFRRR
jgi:peptidoglycan/xylan/chitin deacetylase (PgdA/CDA1 family)